MRGLSGPENPRFVCTLVNLGGEECPMHRPVLIRRYHNQGDIDRLIESGMHDEQGNPYHRSECEWGLLIDNGGYDYETVFPLAREHGITVVPGMRIGDGRDQEAFDSKYWYSLAATLQTCLRLMDRSRRVMFDLENYDGIELAWSGLTDIDREALTQAATCFTAQIREYDVIPLFHPATHDAALARLLLDSSDGKGVAQLEYGSLHIVEDVVSDIASYERSRLSRDRYARRWKHEYPELLVADWTNETLLREPMIPWKNLALSFDGLVWVFDEYRDLDTRLHLASTAHYSYALVSNHDDLRRVWQFAGIDLSERLTQQSGLAAVLGTTVSPSDGWPDIRVSQRRGHHSSFPVFDAEKNGTGVDPLVYLDMDVEALPWTAQVSFAIDPLRFDASGKTVWQRGATLLRQWKNNPVADLFKLEIVPGEENPFLTLTTRNSSDLHELELPIPPHLQQGVHYSMVGSHGPYPVLRASMAMSADSVSLALDGPHEALITGDEILADKKATLERYYQSINELASGSWPNIDPDVLIGPAYYVEILSVSVWSRTRIDFPNLTLVRSEAADIVVPDKWPFHSQAAGTQAVSGNSPPVR